MGLLFHHDVKYSSLASFKRAVSYSSRALLGNLPISDILVIFFFSLPFSLLFPLLASFLPLPRYLLRINSCQLNPGVVVVIFLKLLMHSVKLHSPQRLYRFTVYLHCVDRYICFFQETQDFKLKTHTHTLADITKEIVFGFYLHFLTPSSLKSLYETYEKCMHFKKSSWGSSGEKQIL